MAEKHRSCERKRKCISTSEPPTILKAAADFCKVFGLEPKGTKSGNGLCTELNNYNSFSISLACHRNERWWTSLLCRYVVRKLFLFHSVQISSVFVPFYHLSVLLFMYELVICIWPNNRTYCTVNFDLLLTCTAVVCSNIFSCFAAHTTVYFEWRF